MEFQGNNSDHDALNEILRRYMLENDPTSPDGESLMEMAGESVLAGSAEVLPTDSRKADMIDRLKRTFPEAPQPGPTGGFSWRKAGLIGTGAIAVLATAILLIVNPFGKKDNVVPNGLKGLSSSNVRTLTQDSPMPLSEEVWDNLTDSSLQQGDGNPSILRDVKGTVRGGQNSRKRESGFPPASPTSPPLRPPLGTPSTSTTTTKTAKEIPNPFALRGLFAQTSKQSQFFQVDAGEDHLIKSKKGTVLHIPRHAFVDASSGEAVKSNVQIEIKEIYKPSELIRSNVATVSNNRQLVTGGVVYIDATAAGRRLKLARGKKVYVEFKPSGKLDTRDMRLFHGEMNERGEINWTPDGERFAKMIPLPIEDFYFEEFWCDCQNEKPWNNTLFELSGEKNFGNTWIPTREFRQRLAALKAIGYYVTGLRIYRNNTDKELWKVDQMVADRLEKDYRKKKEGKESDAQRFHAFAQQMKTFSEPFNDHGVDLSRWDARRQLMYRSVSREETERLLRLQRLRTQYVADIEAGLDIRTKAGHIVSIKKKKRRKTTSKMQAIAGFMMDRLGWTGMQKAVDKGFVQGKTRNMTVRLTGDVSYTTSGVFLVYPKMNSVIPARGTTGQLFRLTDVPKGASGWIVAIGYENAVPYLGMRKLPRNARETYVEVRKVYMDQYLAMLREID